MSHMTGIQADEPREQPRTYTVQVSSEIALRYTEWTRISDLDVDWFIVQPRDDGTLEVTLSIGDQPPKAADGDAG